MSNRNEILDKLILIFRDVFDDESIVVSEETVSADIEDWDSLMHITLISEIESSFECKFSIKEVVGLNDVGDMIDLLNKKTVG